MRIETYRKRPVDVQAVQLLGDADGTLGRAIAGWCGGSVYGTFDEPFIIIDTPGGPVRAQVGDWIIRGVKNEHYPCKPDIFAATHDKPTPPESSMGVVDPAGEWHPTQAHADYYGPTASETIERGHTVVMAGAFVGLVIGEIVDGIATVLQADGRVHRVGVESLKRVTP